MGGSFSSGLFEGKGQTVRTDPFSAYYCQLYQKKGEAAFEEITDNLNLKEEELRREFAVLRHMEGGGPQ